MFEAIRAQGGLGGLLIWSALVLVLDLGLGAMFAGAVRSLGFVPASATVTRSDLQYSRKGTAHLELEYTYTANGRQYTGTRYHVEPQLVGNRYWVRAQESLPAGSVVTVYHDPDNPADSVIVPGPRWDQLLVAWALAPFNVIALFGLGIAWARLTGRRDFDPARDARPTAGGWRVRLNGSAVLANTLLALLAITFVGCFVLIAGYGAAVGLPPPGAVIVAAWAVALTASPAYGVWQSRRRVLVVDERAGTVALPPDVGRVTLDAEDVAGVDVVTERRASRGGGYDMFVCILDWWDGAARESARLAEYADRRDADALADWLRDRLGLAAPADSGAGAVE